MKIKYFLICLFVVVLMIISGCQPRPEAKIYDRPLGPGELGLVKITNPYDIPDFTEACYNVANLDRAIDNSLNYLSKPSSEQFYPYGGITHENVVESLKEFRKLIKSGVRGQELNSIIREKFDVYVSVGCDYEGTVLFTGYYTPIFDGALEKTEQFKYPLYKQPKDLVKAPDGEILGRQTENGQIEPYPTRAELENSQELAGEELIWLGDPFEVYIAHVQGSARIRLPDGKTITAGYAANNGHEYKSISKTMVDDGAISGSELSLSAMIDYFKRHPERVSLYTNRNPRFVFFRIEDGPPRGSINEPVIPMRTIATDKSIFPRASLAFILTTLPQLAGNKIYHLPYTGFALDQDTGGAIRAAGRCDVYMGTGEDAGKIAGQTYREGKLYYLFLKPFYHDASVLEKDPLAQ